MHFEICAVPEEALKKLSKAQIPVFRLKKRGAKLYFATKQEYYKKVFAIFSHPCYNTVIRGNSAKMRLISFAKKRFGLIAGAAAFIAACVFSGNVVFKIKITGNCSYLSDSILSIAKSCGAREWSLCSSIDKPMLQAKVMALDGVSFCSVQRRGSYLLIDVRVGEQSLPLLSRTPLKAEASGQVIRVVSICGTAQKAAGEEVKKGEVLIAPYEQDASGQNVDCVAVGFAEISVNASLSLFYDCESEENTKSALAAPSLYSDSVIKTEYKVKPSDGGVVYEVAFSYIVTCSINMQ